MEEQLDEVALLVELAVDAALSGSLFAWRDDGLDPAELQFLKECIRVVAAIAEAGFAGDEVDQFVCDRAVVLLTRSEEDFERPAFQINDGVNLRRETASRTANFIFLGPPRPPAAS